MSLKLKSEFITKDSQSRLYHLDIPVIGLTGGIATGKSTAAEILKNAGLSVLSADQLVKKIYNTSEALSFIKSHYPQTVENDIINFKKLRELVFTDLSVKNNIENFIYAKLPQTFLDASKELRLKNPQMTCLVYDVPLLFEKGLHHKVDISVCVYLPRDVQLDRLINRDKVSLVLAEKILNEQWDIDLKKSTSNIVIENTGTLIDLENNVNHFIKHCFN